MTRKKKILVGIAAFFALAIASIAVTLSYTSACPAAAAAVNGASMQAIVHNCYGGSETLRLAQVSRPAVEDDRVLVRVRAASVNPYDWHMMTGKPYVLRLDAGIGAPTNTRAGVDFAGTVEAVGKNVTQYKVGDEVFGGANGAFGEYVAAREKSIALKPAQISFEQAAAIPIAGLTALQALRDEGQLQAGQKVLINGASGGVGTYAVQIAKAMGAEVTAVCSTKNLELVRSLGADHVIDYTAEDLTKGEGRYHLVVDNVGNHSFSALRRVLEPRGIVVTVGGPKGPWIDPFLPLIKGAMIAPFVDERFTFFISHMSHDDLEYLAGLARDGRMKSVIGAEYPLGELPAALDLVGSRHARGKIVIRVP
ncbi:MAG TPA: NAD(P)-dependent alcohol dehydrogenase [Steroidobacteraceae bacterium]|jgi:NADPH:quinone reductase-like Zn-dependent oxidoreductase|nr:NAD(P)-dependent alcohol dehydrogenase [Steroidobacteraceae bacterium]